MNNISKTSTRTSRTVLLAVCLLLVSCGKAAPTSAPTAAPVEPVATEAVVAAPPTSGFTVIGTINRDVTQAAQNTSLVLGPNGLWATWAENSSGNVRQIFVSELVGEAFEARLLLKYSCQRSSRFSIHYRGG